MYTVKDICARYCVGINTVLGWISRGELRAINVGRSPTKKKARWRITQEALDEFELERTTIPPKSK